MKLLYHIAENRFIIKKDDDIFLVSLKNGRIDKIDDETAQSILRQGYWQDASNLELSEEKREAIASLMSSI